MGSIEPENHRWFERLRDKAEQFIKDSAPTAAGAAADTIFPGAGAIVSIASGLLVNCLIHNSSERVRRETIQTIKELQERFAGVVDMDYLFSDEFFVEFRRFLDMAAREARAEKLDAARNHFLRKVAERPTDAGSHAINSIVDNFLNELSVSQLTVITLLHEAPVGTQKTYRSEHLHTSDEVGLQVGVTTTQAEMILQDLAGRKLVLFYGHPDQGGVLHGPKKSHVWGLSPMGAQLQARINPIATNIG